MKILLCFGTRPEAIKLAPVIRELSERNLSFKICVTAQHREMLDQVLEFFEIQVDYDLSLMKPDQSLNQLSSVIFNEIDKVLIKEQPDLVVVHGDTTTSVLVAWAAFHRKIKVAHIEAGLRTFNSNSPFPEEINRQITARLADIHFAPTHQAKKNLISENISEWRVFVTGNTIVDAVFMGEKKLDKLNAQALLGQAQIKNTGLRRFILVTGHRRESFGQGLESICQALLEISSTLDLEIIFPVHLNPNVRNSVYKMLSDVQGIHLLEPVSYPVMLWLMKNCEFIISDSGGIQEEAPSFGKRVLVTREVSERMEAVEAGTSILVGTEPEKIYAEAVKVMENLDSEKMENPFGDGLAAKRIVDKLIQRFDL